MRRLSSKFVSFSFGSKPCFVVAAIVHLALLMGCGTNNAAVATRPTFPQKAVSVTLSPSSVTVRIGNTQQFQASVVNATNNVEVSWQVNGISGGNETYGTISSTGLYTAPAVAPSNPGIVITAVSSADSTKSGQASVLLNSLTSNFVYVSSPADDKIQSFNADLLSLEPLVTTFVGSGTAPTSLVVHATGKYLYSLNRGTKDISIFAINPDTGGLSLAGTAVTPGSPYAIVFSPNGYYAYISCDDSSVIAVYGVNLTTGALEPISDSPYPVGGQVKSLAILYDGNSLYATNPNDNQIIGLKVNQVDGTLSAMSGSPFSGSKGLSSILATANDVFTGNADGVSAYRRDYPSGSLVLVKTVPTGDSPVLFSNNSSGLLLGVNSVSGGLFAFEADEGLFSYPQAPTATPALPGGVLDKGSIVYVLNPTQGSIDVYSIYYAGASGPDATVQTSLTNPTGFAVAQ